jgi:cytochrome c-type biogenesis protein CcmH
MIFAFPLRALASWREESLLAPRRQGAKGLARRLILILLGAGSMAAPAALRADSSMAAAPYANTALADPAKESQAKALMESVRCLVCQGQSIADSDADMAGDMRSLIRKKIEAGEQPEAIRAYLINSYGDWVSYKPVLDWATAPLWIAPLLFLAAGLWLARGRFRRRKR